MINTAQGHSLLIRMEGTAKCRQIRRVGIAQY